MGNTSMFPSDEERLQDSLKRYQEIINSTPICIKVFDNKGKLIFINIGGRKEHHIEDNDDISKWDWVSTIEDKYRPQVMSAFQNGLSGKTSRVIMEHTPEGSTHHWCEGIISPIKNKDGKVSLLLFYSVDISDKKLAEEELKKRELALRAQNEELNKMNQLMIGRELRIAELKEEVKKLGGEDQA